MPFYLFSTVHAWNCLLVPVFGFPLNVLLFWLVWTKTPKEMRLHSRILLQTCIVDLVFLSVYLVASPLLISQGSTSIVILDGYFMRIFASICNYYPRSLMLINYIAGICLMFDVYSISVQFIYRYLLLTQNIQTNLSRYLMMLILPFVASLIENIFYTFNFGQFNVFDEELKDSLNDYIEWDNSIYIIGPNNETIWILVSFLMIAIFYSANIFCGVKVVKFVGSHAIDPRTKELNQQLTKTLIILASSPLLYFIHMLAIFGLILVMNITRIKSLGKIIMYLQTFGFLNANWVPVSNPIISIWINRPYRDAVNKFITGLFKNNAITPAAVQPPS